MSVQFGESSSPPPIRIVVAEDKPLIADRLAILVAEYSDLGLVGTARTGSAAIALAAELSPDVMLIAERVHDYDGLHLCDHVYRHVPQAALIYVTEARTDEVMLNAVEAGACGLISRMATDEELIFAILRAAEGDLLLPSSVALRLFRRERELRLRALMQQCDRHSA